MNKNRFGKNQSRMGVVMSSKSYDSLCKAAKAHDRSISGMAIYIICKTLKKEGYLEPDECTREHRKALIIAGLAVGRANEIRESLGNNTINEDNYSEALAKLLREEKKMKGYPGQEEHQSLCEHNITTYQEEEREEFFIPKGFRKMTKEESRKIKEYPRKQMDRKYRTRLQKIKGRLRQGQSKEEMQRIQAIRELKKRK